MMQIKPGLYKHYKGKMYEVVGTAKHSETLEELVIYRAMYQTEGENTWVRPKAMFMELVDIKGNKVPRFKWIENQ